ncbi:Glutathione S-transferase [Frankliniella fusca]|uniref:glutathione transferase n=1 Tax=Frankliniella fusca TaxID=407009 RepID=A0AAE1LTS5_9NEOP|nr:Glutathione S-transferase [Frankliniella fusca]
MAPKYKLHYFDVTALGEPIRFLLAYGNLDWEDIRYDDAKWAEAKNKMPFGQMPVLDIDGKIFAQSTAISRYLAKQVGLSGKDDIENLQIDIAVDLFHDFRQKIGGWFYDPIPESKAAKEVQLKEQVPYYLKKFEQIVKDNNGFLVNGKSYRLQRAKAPLHGSQHLTLIEPGRRILDNTNGLRISSFVNPLTWADIYFVAPLKYFKFLYGKDFLEGYPLLQELVKKVESTPAIAGYIAKRPAGDK